MVIKIGLGLAALARAVEKAGPTQAGHFEMVFHFNLERALDFKTGFEELPGKEHFIAETERVNAMSPDEFNAWCDEIERNTRAEGGQ